MMLTMIKGIDAYPRLPELAESGLRGYSRHLWQNQVQKQRKVATDDTNLLRQRAVRKINVRCHIKIRRHNHLGSCNSLAGSALFHNTPLRCRLRKNALRQKMQGRTVLNHQTIRRGKVVLDRNLADLYGVEAKVIRRWSGETWTRFPPGFIVRTVQRRSGWSRSQFATLKRGGAAKYLSFDENRPSSSN